jgi:uncharacterized protein
MQQFLRNPFIRLVLTLIAGVLIIFPLVTVINLVIGQQLDATIHTCINEVAYAIGITLAALIVEWLTMHRTLASLGLPTHSGARDLAFGFVIGAGLFTTILTSLLVTHYYQLNTHVGAGALGILAGGLLLFLATAVFEEVLFRGVIFHLLEDGTGSWVALTLTSFFFGFAHLLNPSTTFIFAMAIALEAGLLFGLLYMLTRSLWLVIGLHWAWDFFYVAFFGSPVSDLKIPTFFHATPVGDPLMSGGQFGPEASVIAVAILLLISGILVWRAIKTHKIIPFPSNATKRTQAISNIPSLGGKA